MYVDEHDDVWLDMVMQPWILPEQMKKHLQRTQKYDDFFEWLFEGEINDKKRIAEGTHVDNYRMFLLDRAYSMELNWKTFPRYIDKLKKKFKK